MSESKTRPTVPELFGRFRCCSTPQLVLTRVEGSLPSPTKVVRARGAPPRGR